MGKIQMNVDVGFAMHPLFITSRVCGRGNVFVIVCVYVCMCVCVCLSVSLSLSLSLFGL